MKRICQKVCSLLLEQNVKKDERDLYEYAVMLLLNFIFNIIVSLFLAFMFNKVFECIMMLTSFLILRKLTGGLHMKRKFTCQIYSVLLIVIFLVYITYFPNLFNSHTIVFIEVFSIIIIFMLSPLENENKFLSDKEQKAYKIVSSFVSLLMTLSIFVFKSNYSIIKSVFFGLFLDTVLLVIGTINNFLKNHISPKDY